ncbi:hypothetical protein HCI99_06265 [Listeria booriae]|uniref:Uncharacterized protein n=1 Tax=Listeria booriae TaxID=1552123 RepID=A0A7X0XCZ8_9LIST|nr:hypothetical protein [Listeria booriae]MBC1491426.1 hypothetical protein [Listeria booriae]MBC6150087.1 hypothetical protein [Listeria booriae]
MSRSTLEIAAIKNYIEKLTKDVERYSKSITDNCNTIAKLQADNSYCNEMADRAEISIKALNAVLENEVS